MEAEEPKKKRGRPPGRRNKPALTRIEDEAVLSEGTHDDYRHTDPETLCSRLLTLVDWQTRALRLEMQRKYQAKGVALDLEDIEKLETLSNTLNRAITSLQRSSDIAEELSKRMSPEQLLEAAAAKLMAQDATTLKYYIKVFRAYLEKIEGEKPVLETAAQAVAGLGE